MAMAEVLTAWLAAPLVPLLAVLAGAALGLVFYGGLWWTVLRLSTFRRPGLSVLASLLLRMGLTLTGFYFVAGQDWQRLLLCLLGFVLARAAVAWLTRLPSLANEAVGAATGVRHAS
jgi:F1F0 ATPase subunit 2